MSEKNIQEQEIERKHLTSAERQKLYQEKATQRRIEEYRKRKRAKLLRIGLIVLAALMLIGAVVAVILLEKNVWKPARIYDEANNLYDAEEYLDAYDVYISLGDYKDAVALASDCITKNAQKLAGRTDVLMGTDKSMPWFKIDENGAIFFDEDKYKGAPELIVPDVFNNKLVTAVGSKAFFYADHLKAVILPPSIRRIEDQSFFACTGINEITLPEYVEFIGEKAFEDCISLSKITFSENLKEIASAAFRNCDALTEVVLPEGFQLLGARSFASCENLASFSFPSTITSIGNKVFDGNEKIISVSYNGSRDAFAALCTGVGNDTILSVKELRFNEN